MPDAAADRISEAEQSVLEALWEAGEPLTASQVAERVDEEKGWSLATVKTLLSRLVAKNAIATEPDGRRFLYSPLIGREAFLGSESRRLLDRLFGGRAASLFAHLAEAEALSERDLTEIEGLLRELRK
ncbi:BlaI/MecI/CopY family transcriptional regulator [Croceicoccus marinus]|jgi:predicted transcriptional regulator|uniref:BlaI/MecI/CopY family transcriptional regulator n=1 Tax=Croceicoccus marinus TaxID=450378 RepID=A0A1Z1F8R6_9SPHN|nr:BlaI/MecI/CopY family transcriptional regulator [Croceicoccus marinus]ARU15181.1 CopY family transcriptional repressor [Croceicoccus marinus]QNE05000.1 BlaI/MecI/CopY family transcriptional regulator [Croceicoccus marinus]